MTSTSPELAKGPGTSGRAPARSEPAPGHARADAWILVGLWLVVLAVFGRVVGDPFSSMDDARFILNNPEIVRPGQVPLADLLLQPHIGYIVPVTGLTEAALFALSGGKAWTFHLLSVLLHATAGCLLFVLARRCRAPRWVAVLVSAVFVLHPVVVEPVAWATGLKDLLMATLALGATVKFVRGVEENDRRSLWWAGLLAMLTALAKPTGAFLGLAWVAFLLARKWGGLVPPRRSVVTAGAVLAFGAVLTVASWHMHNTLLVEDEPEELAGDWQAPLALGHELAHLAWPSELFPRYPIIRDAGFDDPHTSWGLVGAVAFCGLAWFVRRRPGPALGVGLALATYLPVSNVLPFPRMVADSYLYLPLAGLLLVAAPGITWLGARRPPTSQRVILAVGVATVLALGARTAEQVRRWSSPVDLWYPATIAYDDWIFAWAQMGDGLRFRGEHERALHVYEQLFARVYASPYVHKVALVLLALDRLDEAECILVEDTQFGENRERAVHNLAAFIVAHPERTPKYPFYAARSLEWAAQKLATDQLRWPAELIAALPARRVALEPYLSQAPAQAWSPRSCEPLGRDAVDGPP